MPFNNDIAAGNGNLIRNWLQSVDYVPGTSGWRISKDGSAEFNNGTFRGSIEVGSLTGQHFIVNNAATGDIIDVYNTANLLVAKMDSIGGFWTISQPSEDSVVQFGEGLSWQNLLALPSIGSGILGISNNTQSQLTLFSGAGPANAGQAIVTLVDSAANGGNSSVQITQRASAGGVGAVSGTVVQTDTNNVNNVIHGGRFSGTTGAAGQLSIANAATFPILGAVVTFDQSAMGPGVWCAACFNYGTTTLNTQWLQWNGAAVVTYNGHAVAGTYMCWG